MYAAIKTIEYAFPDKYLSTKQLHQMYPEWSIKKIESKTGISKLYYVDDNECASDIGVKAAKKLFETSEVRPKDIDCLIFCTQSPDYFLPTTSCIIQDKLGLSTSTAALDINLGCSGYIYGLGLAKGMIETSQANHVLFITSETYSKFIHPQDKSVKTIFSDGAAATLISGEKLHSAGIGPFIYGTDGSGYNDLIVPSGGMRCPPKKEYQSVKDSSGNIRTEANLFMNGPEIFNFTLKAVPNLIKQLLEKSQFCMDDIDFFIFHQANKYMLEYLQKKIKIPDEKFILSLKDYGNTVSSTIPIALKNKSDDLTIQTNSRLMLVGFGVGYSWGGTIVNWSE